MTDIQVTDVLGEPWLAEEIALPEDTEGPVVATLVSRRAARASRGAVLHVHGFADYFFQTEYAEWWLERGYDFYAVDLRKYGRSMRPHQTPNHVTDLREHFAEIDEAWRRITVRDGHRRVIGSAHSTGGLTLSLWANDHRPAELGGLVLNSPWFDLQGGLLLRTAGTAVVKELGRRAPNRPIPRSVSGVYARSLHREHDGEWDFDLAWKPLDSFVVHAGWMRAIRNAHAELHRGLEVPAPVLVLTSDASSQPKSMCPEVHTHDVVLDVAQIRRWSTAVGPHVTYVAIPGARHDVTLSLAPARTRAYDELGRWHDAYLEVPAGSPRP